MSAKHHTDEDIQAAWDEAVQALAEMIRPYVPTHQVDDMARRYVDGLHVRGWRPPLGPLPDIIAAARARAAEESAGGERP